jgi:hypothetical protein
MPCVSHNFGSGSTWGAATGIVFEKPFHESLGLSHHRALDMTDNTRQACNHLRHALALPLYAIALIISYLSDLIGNIAAKIAADDWPR